MRLVVTNDLNQGSEDKDGLVKYLWASTSTDVDWRVN